MCICDNDDAADTLSSVPRFLKIFVSTTETIHLELPIPLLAEQDILLLQVTGGNTNIVFIRNLSNQIKSNTILLCTQKLTRELASFVCRTKE